MPTLLPPTLQAKLRGYRFAYWSIAAAESLCIGALLISLLNPNWTPLAALWLAWKFIRRPTQRDIAAAIETRHPFLREKLTAAVELAASQDGSAELRRQLLATVERDIAQVQISRLFSLKPVAALIIATIVVNVALTHRRDQQRAPQPAPGKAPVEPTEARPAPTRPLQRLERLKQMAAALETTPAALLRTLPPHVRSLEGALQTAVEIERALDAGDPVEAAALEQSVAETLAEFARLAKEAPQLVALAGQAEELASEYAMDAARLTSGAAGIAASPGKGELGAMPSEVRAPTGPLPATAPTGLRWVATARPLPADETLRQERIVPRYESQIQNYFERISSKSR